MNNSNEPGAATDAFDTGEFWEHLEVSLEFFFYTGSNKMLRLTMQDYDAHAAQLNVDMVRDAKRWAMLQQALAAFTRH
jgi:hypothetical protein